MKIGNRKKILVISLSIVFIAYGVVVLQSDNGENINKFLQGNDVRYTTHDIIRIDSNSEFNPPHGVTGGSGTQNDPWIISDWEIDAMAHGDGIYIGNTSDYFVIENCYIYNTSSTSSTYDVGAGIHFLNVKNGEVRYTTILDTNGDGISLSQSSFNVLEYNMLKNIKYGGISLGQSGNNTVNGNIMEHANTGMFVSNSSNNTFKDNIISNINYNGVIIYAGSRDDLVINNTISNNQNGIYLYWGANNNTIKGNFLANNSGYGVYVNNFPEDSPYNIIIKNLFYYNNGSGDYYDSSTVQARDNATNNFWYAVNQGYGNYWREWANNNNTNDQNPQDGVVDWVYHVSGSSKSTDKFPLKYAIPTPPQNLTAKEGGGYINLTWKAPMGDGGKATTNYRIYRNESLITTVPATQLYYNDTSVSNGKNYTYYVTAVNEEGEGLKSNYVQATPSSIVPEFSMESVIFFPITLILLAIFFKKRN